MSGGDRLRGAIALLFFACGAPKTAAPPPPHPIAVRDAAVAVAVADAGEAADACVPTGCAYASMKRDEVLELAFAKANREATAAIREGRDPLAKRIAEKRTQLSEKQIADLEARRPHQRPSRSDAKLLGLKQLLADTLCIETPEGGAWAIGIADVDIVPSEQADLDEPAGWKIESTLRLRHFDRAGAEIAIDPQALLGAKISGEPVAPQDLDGDGAAEWLVRTGDHYEPITFAKNAIVRYRFRPPLPITTVRGKNFFHQDFLGTKKPCFGGPEKEIWGPELAITVIGDGSFSASDPAARKANEAWCPEAPSRIDDPDDAVCARIFGKDALAMLRKDNVPDACKATPWNEKRTVNELYPFIEKAAKLPVPYVTGR